MREMTRRTILARAVKDYDESESESRRGASRVGTGMGSRIWGNQVSEKERARSMPVLEPEPEGQMVYGGR